VGYIEAMPADRRVRATFAAVRPTSTAEEVGVELEFRLERKSLGIEIISDFAQLGPEHCIPAVSGLGKVLRILRAARIATPPDERRWLGAVDSVAVLLERAVGTPLVLEVRPRSRIRFLAWTEEKVEVIENVTEVVETPDTYFVSLRRGRHQIRVPRENVVRQLTETHRWFEILSIERG
jgi:hypothetical protein